MLYSFYFALEISSLTNLKLCDVREVEEKRTVVDGNVDEIAKELQRLEGKKFYLEEDKTDLSGALDRQRHIFESKVIDSLLLKASPALACDVFVYCICLFIS